LRVTTSVAFGRRVMVPLVLPYMREHPQLVVDLAFDDRYVNLVEQGVDLAVRMGRLADSSLGARYLGTNPWLMVAAPAYLGAHGEPRSVDELATRPCLVYSSVQGDDRWLLTGPQGHERSVPVRAQLRSNNLSALLAAAMDGLGLAVLPWYVANEALAQGRLRPVMADHRLPAQEIHAVFPSPRLVPAKVTSFIAWLQRSLAGEWWLRSGAAVAVAGPAAGP
ncbi:MAG TPA: substrate binding domain-containing protein, partial [Gemmatimonadales bacterium]|nr:substrate binding domain-containing protein [Gemmatimonadales bacterium]